MDFTKRFFWLAAFSVLLFCLEAKAASFLYAINDNAAGNQIYGFSVNETSGALTALAGFPVATGFNGGGSTNLEMITIDRLNKRLYAINRGSNNISAYSINDATGGLAVLPFSPIAGIANERVIKVHPSGSPLIVGGDEIASYVISSTSATPAAGSPYSPGANVSPAGATFSRDGNYFYTGGNLGDFFAGFAVNPGSGVLSALPGSPFNSGNQTPNPTATDATGRLFVINSRQALTRVYTTAAGVPAQVAGSPFANGLTSFASDGEVHPNGNFFMLADRTGNRIGVYQISGSGADTTLTAVAGSPFATGGTSSIALAFNQTGNFLFVGNGTSRNITTFSVNTSTGELTNRVVQTANALGAAGLINGIAYINFAPAVNFDAPLDFNGDGKSDYVVTRSANATSPSTWYINYNGSGNGLSYAVQFGIGVGLNTATSDRAVPEDFDGDDKDDIAVWRPTGVGDPGKAYFFILQSSTSTVRFEQFGRQGDDPSIVRDYDGDGKSDVAVFRKGNAITTDDPCGGSAIWYYRPSATPAVNFRYTCWGAPADFPLPGDFDGDGKGDFVVQRSNGSGMAATFFLNKSGGGTEAVNWGLPTDILVPGDYDGDGKTDIAISRAVSGTRNWFILERDGGTQTYQFGSSVDAPAMGDYNGDGKTDIATWRTSATPGQVFFFVRPAETTGAADFQFQWGQQNDYPVARYNVH
ncbi:MAG: hypothetical protein AVDCRST_MAG74-2048 [uncultured Pyrinomonadaceae bacterium]|uniref:Alkaline phosphatase n=1 Tax=uncultured Pyrinomonadaceae bacterium TaxID=2283094 RepID=A0A6J4PDI7_9BACT|nr:MAG: hypothetical protein AVDCRST_MAG74-2048 [uncultured Pyrinomonadaceae bacterium]